MNKKLLAVAVAGAFAAPVAMADTGNVTIYGTISMSVESVDGGSGGSSTPSSDNAERRARVSSNTSYLGFKGKEDLGNGMDAHFQLEQGMAVDTGTLNTPTNNRSTFMGVGSKSWGSVDFGFMDSPLKTSTGKTDLYGGGHTLADYRSLFVTRNTNVRQSSSVMYTSPNFNGFTAKVMTAAQQEAGSSKSPSFWSASGTYENGPIFATLAYEQDKAASRVTNSTTTLSATGTSLLDNGGGVTGIGGQNLGCSVAATAAGSTANYAYADCETKTTTWRAGFGYNFGPGKIAVAYQKLKTTAKTDLGGAGTGVATIASGLTGTLADSNGDTEYKRDSWHVSGEYNITKATAIGLQYTKAGKVNNIDNSGANQWTLGVKQAMSKRTTAYALYTQVRNQSGASYLLGGGATGTDGVKPAAAGEDPKAIVMGLIHKF